MESKPLLPPNEPLPDEQCSPEAFLNYVRATGSDPVAAAKLFDTPVRSVRGARNQFRIAVKALVENYSLPPEAAKKLAQSIANKIMVDAAAGGDWKMALEASKQVRSDQDVFGPQKIEITTRNIDTLLEKPIDYVFADDDKDEENGNNE